MGAKLPTGFYARTLARAYPESDTYKIALYEDVPNLDIYSSSGECKGDGYATGGTTLKGWKVIDKEVSASLAFDCTIDWFDVSIKTRGAVVYHVESGAILTLLDFTKQVGVIGGIFTLRLSEEGVVGIGVLEK
jgi:hypothetical protein